MPLINSDYNPPILFKNSHFSTIYAGVLRKIDGLIQERERITLPDADFLDLDWSYTTKTTSQIAILVHGLEGDAQRSYIKGSAKIFNTNGYDVCAINLRSCSGEMNRLYRSYHSGATEDLEAVIQHVLQTKKYTKIVIKGFSLGGNITLKYLGEKKEIPKEIKAAIAVSVPCDLRNSQIQLHKFANRLYANRFKKKLKQKLVLKQTLFPDKIVDRDIQDIKTLKDFDDFYTSTAHGFIDALDYYKQCSCKQFLPNINLPTLLVNAQNDSFLGNTCYPLQEAENSPYFYLEIPKYGGHVGFYDENNQTYTEKRALKFIQEAH